MVANLVAQIAIVVTGGAVRLTSSGLGCSQWPECEPGSFLPVYHPETGIHRFVEFGNRTLTGVLLVIAVAVVLLVAMDASRARDVRRWAWVPFVLVVVQAVVGGITVLVDLHPAIVGSHFLLSMVLVAASTWLLVRLRDGEGPVRRLVEPRVRALTGVLVAVGAVMLALGVVVTGAGPHSGDDEVGYRFAVDPERVARVHAASVWLFIAVLVVVLVLLLRRRTPDGPSYSRADGLAQPARGVAATFSGASRPARSGVALLVVALAQGLIGYVQFFTGLPIALVNLHMLGAAVLTAMLTWFVGAQRTRA